MTHIITNICAKDTACVDVCPVDCIYPSPAERNAVQQLFINPEVCIDCGLCVDACPREAIFPLEEVPNQHRQSVGDNYRHFSLEPPDL